MSEYNRRVSDARMARLREETETREQFHYRPHHSDFTPEVVEGIEVISNRVIKNMGFAFTRMPKPTKPSPFSR